MGIQREDFINIDLQNGNVHRSFVNHTIVAGDKNANVFGVRIYRDNVPEDLTGCTVMGLFIRADKTTVIIGDGIAYRNAAYVYLPESCYAVPGNFTLTIKVSGGNMTGAMRIVDGTVFEGSLEPYVDPGNVIPDLSELMAVIDRAEAAAAEINEFVITTELIAGDDYRIIVNDGGD